MRAFLETADGNFVSVLRVIGIDGSAVKLIDGSTVRLKSTERRHAVLWLKRCAATPFFVPAPELLQ